MQDGKNKFICPDCKKEGEIGILEIKGKKYHFKILDCDCQNKTGNVQIKEQIIPKKYLDIISTKLETEFIKKEILKYRYEIIENIKTGKNLILVGNYGTGKSISACLIMDVAINNGFSVKFLECSEYQHKLYNTDINLDRLGNYDLLVLDNFGKNFITPLARAFFSALVDLRIRNKKATIYTINEKAEDIKKNIDEMITDRLLAKENEQIIYKGQSLR